MGARHERTPLEQRAGVPGPELHRALGVVEAGETLHSVTEMCTDN